MCDLQKASEAPPAASASEGSWKASHEGRKQHSVGSLLERIGLSTHHFKTIFFAWLTSAMFGWIITAGAFTLEAASYENGDWARRSSEGHRLSQHEKSLALLTMGFVGILADPLFGAMSDLVGRIGAVKMGAACCVVINAAIALAPTKTALMVLMALSPFGSDFSFVLRSLVAEWLPIYYRGFFLVTLNLTWNLGRLALTTLWMVIPPEEDWKRFFTWVSVYPTIVFVLSLWQGLQFESPRWLAVSGDREASVANLRLAAERMKPGVSALPSGWDVPKNLVVDGARGHVIAERRPSSQQVAMDTWSSEVRDITWKLMVHFFLLSFTSGGVFYWIIAFLRGRGETEAVPYVMAAAPLAKIACNGALLIGGPQSCPIDRWQRIPLMRIGYVGYAVCLGCLCVVKGTVAIILAVFFSQICEGFLWTASGVYTTEQLPTNVRNSCLGVIWMVAGVGSIGGEGFGGFFMDHWLYLHMVVMAVVSVLGALNTFLLPGDRTKDQLVDVFTENSHTNDGAAGGGDGSGAPILSSSMRSSYGAVGRDVSRANIGAAV